MDEETLKVIQKVADKLCTKYTFDIYDEDDIRQEIFLLCIEALPRWDKSRPLENFLYIHAGNRLKTFIRDNYYIDKGTWVEDRKKLVKRTLSLDEVNLDTEHVATINFGYDQLYINEIFSIIDANLPNHLRADYLRLRAGVSISTSRKNNVIDAIRDILKNNGYDIDERSKNG